MVQIAVESGKVICEKAPPLKRKSETIRNVPLFNFLYFRFMLRS
jgi:hypothetical protein